MTHRTFKTHGRVYFVRQIGGNGPIKIGCSMAPLDRLEVLMVWSPEPLEIIAAIEGDLQLERRLHGIFADLHSHHEWFRPEPRLTSFVAAIAAGTPVFALIDFSAPILPFNIQQREPLPTETRRRLGYVLRIHHAFNRLRKAGAVACWPSYDVETILDDWKGCRASRSGAGFAPVIPTAGEIAFLDEVIRHPERYAITSEELRGAAA